MSGQYILKNGVPVPEPDLLVWGRWLETANEDRRVAYDVISPELKVSTVFLALDHSFKPGAEPILYETMVFGGPLDGSQERYATKQEAQAGHARWLEKVKDSNA